MFWVTAIITVALDLVSKFLIDKYMFLETNEHIIPGVLDFNYIHNDGCAWGMLGGKQSLLILATSAIIFFLIGYIIVQGNKICKLEKLSLGLIVGGGIGNLVGRVADGFVIDFFKFAFLPDFPRFNVADIGVTCGCVLLIIAVFFIDGKNHSEN